MSDSKRAALKPSASGCMFLTAQPSLVTGSHQTSSNTLQAPPQLLAHPIRYVSTPAALSASLLASSCTLRVSLAASCCCLLVRLLRSDTLPVRLAAGVDAAAAAAVLVLTMLLAELCGASLPSSSAYLCSEIALRCSSVIVTMTWLRLDLSLRQVLAVWRFRRTCCTRLFISLLLLSVTFCQLYLEAAAADEAEAELWR